jgi:hypothetical protein
MGPRVLNSYVDKDVIACMLCLIGVYVVFGGPRYYGDLFGVLLYVGLNI